MEKNKTVEDYIAKKEQWQDVLMLLRKIILSTGLEETIKWGAPVYTESGKNIVGIAAFKNYAGIWFFQGALLEDKEKKLVNAQEGKTKALRQWRFSSLEEVDKKLLTKYIREAIENQKAGKVIKAAKPVKSKDFEIPPLLKKAFDGDKKVDAAFQKLSIAKQREYVIYIDEAKREATKVRRLEKILPMILAGQGINDRYK